MKSIGEFIKPSLTCSFCNKNCKSKRACLINQIVNQINFERIGTKFKPVKYIQIAMKLPKEITEHDIEYTISICKDYKNRNGSFSKCFFGCLKAR